MNYIALVDCNSFFVSCEQVFNPQLKNKPVVVLSSNDGCVVSRSIEAKKIGIPMGAPIHKYQEIVKKNGVITFSSNFTLYAEMSKRVMGILETMAEAIEVYSIDEAFLTINTCSENNLLQYIQEIKKKVYDYIGMPVSIGASLTKTLAKAANRLAKNDPTKEGICYLSKQSIDYELKNLPIEDVWGIGRRLTKKLKYYGIFTALDLKSSHDKWIQKKLSIQGLRIAQELRGIRCSSLEIEDSSQKTMMHSRSFGRNVSSLEELNQIVSDYANTLARKLRKRKLLAENLIVWITTNRFLDNKYSCSAIYNFFVPSNYTPELIFAAQETLKKIYKPNLNYTKISLLVAGLVRKEERQLSFFEQNRSFEKEEILMKTIDKLNYKHRKNMLFYASSGIKQTWRAKQLKRSPLFLSDWNQLMLVKVDT